MVLLISIFTSGCASPSTTGKLIIDGDFRNEKIYASNAWQFFLNEKQISHESFISCYKPYSEAIYSNRIDYSNDDVYCPCFKERYIESMKNYNEFIGLDAPESLQKDHFFIESFLNISYHGYYEQYLMCMSNDLEDFIKHDSEASLYKTKKVFGITQFNELYKNWMLKYYGITVTDEMLE